MLISLSNIKKVFNGKEVISDANFTVNELDKIGIVGLNGSGKTTIFKMIKGIEYYDDGEIFIKKGVKIGYLDQIPVYEMKVKDCLMEAFKDLKEIENELAVMEQQIVSKHDDKAFMSKYSFLQNEFLRLDGYLIDTNLKMICNGLKIDEKLLNQDFMTLSGGEKSRVVLGKVLLEKPDLLLLDEPTNHLDMDSINFLENYLNNYQGACLIISHDRYLLDKVCKKIINVENGRTKEYKGNYSEYLVQKSLYVNQMLVEYEAQQKKIKNLEEQIARFKLYAKMGGGAKMDKKAKSRMHALEKIQVLDKPVEDKQMTLNLKKATRTSKELIRFKDYSKSYGDKLLIKPSTFTIYSEDKAILIGKNGTGKTSLFKSMIGETDYDGKIEIANSCKVGYFRQEISYKDPNRTVIHELEEALDCNDFEARTALAKFLFIGDDVFKKVGDLSGGEKAKLELCKIINSDFNTLFLDEPTNHLDIESKEMLELALDEYNGTIFAISHDRYFIKKIASYLLELDNKEITRYDDNFDEVFSKEEVKEEKPKEEVKKEKKSKLSNNKLKEINNRIEWIENRQDELKELNTKELAKDNIDFGLIQAYQDENDELEMEYLELLETLEENEA